MQEGRIIQEHKTNYIISDGDNEIIATIRGLFFNEGTFPKVGDYVLFNKAGEDKAVIEEILPRKSVVTRKEVETDAPQVIVANVDIIFIVMGLDNDFNLSRLERYLLLAKQSNVESIIILNKCDNEEDFSEYITKAKTVSGEIPVYAVSALTGQGMDVFQKYFNKDTTGVLLGSSGAGKSTITNWLLQEDKQPTNEVRAFDSRGRHTTTSRHLFSLPTGGYLIDTPGMRRLSILESTTDDEKAVFEELSELATQCEFSNCDHQKSKGCQLLIALENGDISERQVQSYTKLKKERVTEEKKRSEELARQNKRKLKQRPRNFNKTHPENNLDSRD
jgi:ribosome biogenesis GTPase